MGLALPLLKKYKGLGLSAGPTWTSGIPSTVVQITVAGCLKRVILYYESAVKTGKEGVI